MLIIEMRSEHFKINFQNIGYPNSILKNFFVYLCLFFLIHFNQIIFEMAQLYILRIQVEYSMILKTIFLILFG